MFSVSIIQTQNFEFLNDGNKHPKSSQTLYHSWDPQVLDDGSWKLSDITQFLDYPNKLFFFHVLYLFTFFFHNINASLYSSNQSKWYTQIMYFEKDYRKKITKPIPIFQIKTIHSHLEKKKKKITLHSKNKNPPYIKPRLIQFDPVSHKAIKHRSTQPINHPTSHLK